MKWILHRAISVILFLWIIGLHAQATRLDSCGINDACASAIIISNIASDQPFVCIEGCNLDAGPGEQHNSCGIGDFPTVWFQVLTDGNATLMNINVSSDDFDAPTLSLFQRITDCGNLQNIDLTASHVTCVVGSEGEAEAIGSNVGANKFYYIAVSSFNAAGGHFTLCVNTIGAANACVTNADIEVVARSGGGSLDGPFYPDETVSICMKVNSYSAAGNGCQWIQGLIPVFGNGWDPASFDGNGQPLNTTLNGDNIGVPGNGLYGASTWDWFTEIGYHHKNAFFQIGDFDNNSSVEMCNVLYDVNCPNLGGINGGCCGPCWDDAGDPLPPGWFAYGINGTCPTLGPPPTVDWGDGNTCEGGMGPWHFCFDLHVRDYPDCNMDPTTKDLTLGFFTTADGETGSWTGGPSVCSLDQPIKRTFVLQCQSQIDLGFEELPDICNGSQFVYEISEPGVNYWSWEITPSWAVQDSIREGDNGYVINNQLHNQLHTPVTVTYIFTGQDTVAHRKVIKKVRFRILAPIEISFFGLLSPYPDSIIVCPSDTNSFFITVEVKGGTGNYEYAWWPFGTSTPSIELLPPFQSIVSTVMVTDEFGCVASKNISLIVDQNCVVNHVDIHNDESNDHPKKEDPPVGDGNFYNAAVGKRAGFIADEESISIYPIPSKDRVVVEWTPSLIHPSKLFLYDSKGTLIQTINITKDIGNQLQVDIRNINPGVYIVILQSDRKIKTARIVKM